MINSECKRSRSHNFVLQEERKSLYCSKNCVRKIILIIPIVFLCVISVMVIAKFCSDTSVTDNQLLTVAVTPRSSFNKDEDPEKQSKHPSSTPTFLPKNETIISIDDNDKTRDDYPDLCKNASFDTILSYKNDIFVLKDYWYWKLSNNSIAPEYPKPISQKWPGLPNNVDASFTDCRETYTYFFKGSQYWKFDGEKLEDGFPREISIDFNNLPDNLQASSTDCIYDQHYFFKGDLCWVVNMNNLPYETRGIIYPMDYWPGIPSDLDAVLRSTSDYSYIIFFKENRYYKYHKDAIWVQEEGLTASDWFGCDSIKAT